MSAIVAPAAPRIITMSGNQPGQHAFLLDYAPGETLYQGGFGSGKSHAGARKTLRLHRLNCCPSAVYAPTYSDLWRFVVPKLIETLDAWGVSYRLLKGSHPHLTVWGQPIFIQSCEIPSRIAGYEIGAAWLDEGARVVADPGEPLKNAPLQIRARIRHPKAKIRHLMVTTTPEGLDSWVEEQFVADPRAAERKRRVYYGSTLRNAALSDDFKRDQLENIPAQLREQYVEGHAVQFSLNRAHPGFSRTTHCAPLEFDKRLPIYIGCDFNVKPMAWTIGQIHGDGDKRLLHVLDEVYLPDHATVENAVHAVHAKGYSVTAINFHPDRAGVARSTTGDSEHVAIAVTAKALGMRFNVQGWGGNPPIVNRINLVDRLIAPAAGPHRLSVHPRCKRLILELETTSRLKSGQYDPGIKGDRGHILDALGYMAFDTMQTGLAPMGTKLT